MQQIVVVARVAATWLDAAASGASRASSHAPLLTRVGSSAPGPARVAAAAPRVEFVARAPLGVRQRQAHLRCLLGDVAAALGADAEHVDRAANDAACSRMSSTSTVDRARKIGPISRTQSP